MHALKVWAVVRREFIERVRTKWFIISTVLGPVFLIGIMVLPAVLATRDSGPRTIAIVDDGSGGLAERVLTQFSVGNRFIVSRVKVDERDRQAALDTLTGAVQAKRLDGFLLLKPTTLETGKFEYQGRNVASLRDMQNLEVALRQIVVVERLTRRGIDPGIVEEAQQRIELETKRITKKGATGETGEATFFLAYSVGFVLYMMIFLYAVNVMRSVIEEKQTRIIEVLVSSMKPFELMLGKVIGVGGVGLFQCAIWGASALALLAYGQALFGFLHITPEQAAAVKFPDIGLAFVLITLAYFLFGYIIYSALFAVVGASVNTEAEAQQAQMPVTMLLVAAIIMFPAILQEPGGRLGVTMGMIPFFSPIIMPIRYAASEVPPAEVALSLAVLVLSTLLTVWVAARIYRVGILMYGKRPSFREMIRWARET
jgi:ABC-2 type transport system permease protein